MYKNCIFQQVNLSVVMVITEMGLWTIVRSLRGAHDARQKQRSKSQLSVLARSFC